MPDDSTPATAAMCEATTVWQGRLIRCRRSVPLPHDDHFGNHGFSEFGTIKWSTATAGSPSQDHATATAAMPLAERCQECLCPECFPPDSPCPACHGRGIGRFVDENHRPDEMTVTYGD